VRDRNGNNSKMYNETLRPILHSGHKQPPAGISIAEQTGGPHPSPITFMLSSLFDGLEVLDPLQSCKKQAGESSSRCFYKAEA